jgi:hypothetical protein
MTMFRKIQTLLKTLTQFFIQKPSGEGNWQWVWDDASGQAIKHDSNPWLAYYASSPTRNNNSSNPTLAETQSQSGWTSQKLIEFSEDKSRGFLPGINPKIGHR